MTLYKWTYHKTGTVLLRGILERVGELTEDIAKASKGVHCVRHPFEIVASGYKYHKRCDYEEWLVTPNEWDMRNLSAKSNIYKEILNELDQHDGILFEIHNAAQDAIRKMSKEYIVAKSDPRFLSIRLEDMSTNFKGTCRMIAEHLEVDPIKFLEIASPFDKNREGYFSKHVTNPARRPHTYSMLLDDFHKCEILSLDTNVWEFMKEYDYEW
jgi:hypothetical protein